MIVFFEKRKNAYLCGIFNTLNFTIMKKLFILLFIAATFSVAGYSQTYHYDVNGDGVVTAADVTALYDYLLGNVPGGDQFDVNGDGVVTAADVTALYDYLLGNVPSGDEHEYVDLGLPSGTLWATMNVGANSPEEYGDYFAWGETTPKDVYDLSTYKWYRSDNISSGYTKYCNESSRGYNGFTDGNTELDPKDDAATANWGSQWRMPSEDQIQELYDNCTEEVTTINGVNGRLFTSNINGASLFLPAAGYRWGSSFYNGPWMLGGYYWSRTLDSTHSYAARVLFIACVVRSSSGGFGLRLYGYTVRAVSVP
jgi:hypothetical protein